MSRPRLIALLLALITLAVFLPAGRCDFVDYDDDTYVTENQMVQAGWTLAGLKWAFTTGYANNWHPLTWLSHMTDCQLFQRNPGAHHLVNVLFHAANTALLFTLLRRLTGRLWSATFIAALFAWHPLHVESVAWVSERKDVLSTFFGLLSLLCYAKYVQEKSARSFRLALLFFALGLMAKPMLVTLPFVMLLLDWWPLQRSEPSAFRLSLVVEKWPFLLLTVLSCVATYLAQASTVHGGAAVTPLGVVAMGTRLGNLPLACAGYLSHCFWPAGLAIFYPMPKLLLIPFIIGDTLLLLGISTLAWYWRKTRPYLAVGWLWFLGMLVPVSGLVMVGGASMADRYTYLPMVGIFIIIAFAVSETIARFPSTRTFFCAGAGIVTIACIFITEKQLSYWKNSETLFRRDLAVTEDNDVARNELGLALQIKGDLPGALEQYQAAARLYSKRAVTHHNLANTLASLGQHAAALDEYREAIRLQPGNPALHASTARELGLLGRFDEALMEFSEAEKYDPAVVTTHIGAARTLFKLGRDAEAIEELRAAVRLDPESYQTLTIVAHYLAANENEAARDPKNALPMALRASEISGRTQPVVFDVLGMAFAANGDFTNATTCAQNALDLATVAQLSNTEPIRARLELYRKNQPWRESFRATNTPAAKQ